FTKGGDQTVLEDAGLQTVPAWATNITPGNDLPPDANEAGQTLTFVVQSVAYSSPVYNSNATFFTAIPAIDPATGNLTYQTAPNANGTATVTIVLKDNGGTGFCGLDTSAPQTFVITVTAVNDRPSFTKGADQNILE